MKVVGHNLCWHSQTPAWMFRDEDGKPLPRDEALKNLKDHIDGVVGHFKGKVIGWDVVNEAISDAGDDYLRDTPAHAPSATTTSSRRSSSPTRPTRTPSCITTTTATKTPRNSRRRSVSSAS